MCSLPHLFRLSLSNFFLPGNHFSSLLHTPCLSIWAYFKKFMERWNLMICVFCCIFSISCIVFFKKKNPTIFREGFEHSVYAWISNVYTQNELLISCSMNSVEYPALWNKKSWRIPCNWSFSWVRLGTVFLLFCCCCFFSFLNVSL